MTLKIVLCCQKSVVCPIASMEYCKKSTTPLMLPIMLRCVAKFRENRCKDVKESWLVVRKNHACVVKIVVLCQTVTQSATVKTLSA